MSFFENTQTLTVEHDPEAAPENFRLVSLDANGYAEHAAAGEQAYGVAIEVQEQGDTVLVFAGVTKCVAGDAIDVGANVAVGADGKAVTAGTGDVIVGVARSSTEADEEFVALDFRTYMGEEA